jgi:hypothetical protein
MVEIPSSTTAATAFAVVRRRLAHLPAAAHPVVGEVRFEERQCGRVFTTPEEDLEHCLLDHACKGGKGSITATATPTRTTTILLSLCCGGGSGEGGDTKQRHIGEGVIISNASSFFHLACAPNP